MNHLYNTLAAIATAHTIDTASEALAMADELVERAFLETECAIAALVHDAACKRIEALIMENA